MLSAPAWYTFFGPTNPDYQRACLKALSGAGVRVRALDSDDAKGPGIVFFAQTTALLHDRVRQLSDNGVNRLLLIAPARSVVTSTEVWRLLADGASDVIARNDSFDAIALEVADRLARWARIDAIINAPLVRDNIVGSGPTWTRLLRRAIEAALFSDAPILLSGETGTGKELIAQLVHTLDTRPGKTGLVVLDCTTVQPTLSGSEFFGHERGAFTGAIAARDGVFTLADGGTLFLDEIGDLKLELQPELLRVLQEGTYKRVGGNSWRTTHFRLICATNRDLAREVTEGRFRRDLYHRIASIQLRLPALRERPEDIIPLARHFLERMRPNVDPPELDDALRDFLLNREYAGNVRDLKQLVAGLVYRYSGRGTITPGYLDDVERPDKPELMDWRDEGFDRAIRVAVARGVTLREIGRAAADSAIRVAFDQTGSLQGAARRLGVTDRALQMRRKKGESAVRLPVEEEHSVATRGALLSPSPGDVSLPSYKTDELKG